MNHVQVQATISKVTTLSDGALRVWVDTPELPPDHEAVLFSLRKQNLWATFSIFDAPMPDLPETPPADLSNGKTPSQRLRSIMFIWYKTKHGTEVGFNQMYERWIEVKINEFSNAIDEMK